MIESHNSEGIGFIVFNFIIINNDCIETQPFTSSQCEKLVGIENNITTYEIIGSKRRLVHIILYSLP